MAVIYALECSVNGFAYIGVTSSKLSKRLREHRCLCRNNKHHAVKLTADWLKYGEGAFSIKPLEEGTYSHRGARCETEQKWINHYASLGKLYNAHEQSQGLSPESIRKGVANAHKERGNRWTPEANDKRSRALKGRVFTPEHCAQISAAKRAKKQ